MVSTSKESQREICQIFKIVSSLNRVLAVRYLCFIEILKMEPFTAILDELLRTIAAGFGKQKPFDLLITSPSTES